jgi:probable rRNA maturation factor
MAKQKEGKIRFNFVEQTFRFPERTKLKVFILELFKKERVPVAEVNYIFCADEYLGQINKDFLKHNTYTDIITFQYNAEGEPAQSDIYISVDRVRENAKKFEVPFLHELYRVVFHGALHLCGYNDKKDKETKEMTTMEDYYLNRYVPRGTR